MKTLTSTLLILLTTTTAAADPKLATVVAAGVVEQPADRPETIFNERPVRTSWYVAPTSAATTIDDDLIYLPGVRGAWLPNRNLGLGLAFNVFMNEEITGVAALDDARVAGVYGGFMLQYVVGSTRLVHGLIDTTLGGGGLCIREPLSSLEDCESTHAFFAIEPTLSVEINVASFARLAVGGGYRFAFAEAGSPLSNSELGGFVARTSFEFGQFR